MKTCTRCQIEKSHEEFYTLKRGGFATKCRSCFKVDNLIWRENNKERYKEYQRKYVKSHPEKVNIEKRKEQRSKWIAKNPEARRLDRKNQKIKRKLVAGKISNGRVSELLILQKNKCPCCKLPLGEDYHIDHIVPLSKGGLNIDSNIQLLRKECNLRKARKNPIDFMQERGFLC